MLTETSKSIIFEPARCTQCGGCLAACKTGSLKALPTAHGLFCISWSEEKCNHCLACIRTCPAHHLPLAGFDPAKLEGALDFSLAFARNQQVRKQASSGGAGRILVKKALDSEQVELAYTLKTADAYPWAEGGFWQKGEDIANMPNSMYLPILVMKNMKLREKQKSLLVVGTACQLLAAEKLIGKKVEQLYKVAIYCKQQKDFRATEYCARRLKLPTGPGTPGEIRDVVYRGEGWPGRMMINRRSLPYEQAAAVPFGKRLWRVPGCRFCHDAFGLNADLTLLDPWGIGQKKTLGETLVVTWTAKGAELLQAAAGELQVESLSPEEGRQAINVADMRRKSALVDYYLGRRVNFRTWLAGKGETLQAHLYQTILEAFRLPTLAHKLIAHAPDLRNLFLSGSSSKKKILR
jgi:coenzyme F420-reducing hydrogenase beta subunit